MIRLIHESYPRNINDSAGNKITIYKPIERIAVLTTEDYEILRTLNCTDKIVAAGKYVVQSKEQGCGDLYADGAGFVNIGSPTSSIDWEALIKSSPDLVITYMSSPKQEDLDQNLKDTNITVIRWDSGNISQYIDIIDKMGYLLDRNDEAKKYDRFFEEKLGKYLDTVSDLPPAIGQRSIWRQTSEAARLITLVARVMLIMPSLWRPVGIIYSQNCRDSSKLIQNQLP